MLAALLGLFEQEHKEGEVFGACMDRLGETRLKAELSNPCRAVPSFEEDPLFYEDWGHANERFAVRQGVKGECAGTTIAERVPSPADAAEALAQADAYFSHHEYEAAALGAYEAAAAAARVPLYRRLVDPFRLQSRCCGSFENLFVLSGQTNGAWSDFTKDFARLAAAVPLPGRRERPRNPRARRSEFTEFCKTAGRSPIRSQAPPRARRPPTEALGRPRRSGNSRLSRWSACQLASMMFSEQPTVLQSARTRAPTPIPPAAYSRAKCSSTIRTL